MAPKPSPGPLSPLATHSPEVITDRELRLVLVWLPLLEAARHMASSTSRSLAAVVVLVVEQ
jgi:hypothetical protein